MTMVSTGEISLGGSATSGGLNQSVNIELGRSATASINMNESAVRTLAGVASGAISMSNFYGKSNQFSFTISTNQTNGNLRTLAINAGWNQSSKLVATINAGVYVSSNSTGTPGLTISGSFPGGVDLINNGFIIGMGGAGANLNGSAVSARNNGSPGGLALSVASAVSITNNGTIGGGGGGGGTGGGYFNACDGAWYGGVGGGGRTGTTNSAGGNGGGTVPNGSAGTLSAPGAGSVANYAGRGGTGGQWGTAGNAGNNSTYTGGGGGAAGGAISGNANITWVATGTRLGPIT